MKRKFIVLAALLALCVFGQQQMAEAQSNLVNNPSFEDPYNSGVASAWAPWHEDSNEKKDCNSERYVVQPKWSPELNPSLVLDGARSMHVGNQFDTWRGGVFQTVDVPAGSTYRFSAWARGRGSNEQYPAPSDTSVNMRVRVGIDPTGGGLWTSGNIVWSSAISPHDNWQQATVEVPVSGGKVTVFVEGDISGPNQCRSHLDIWFDKAELVAVGPPPTNTPAPVPTSPPPPPPPPATNTPIPEPTAVPTETPVPSPTPIPPTPTPTGGTICINTFNDSDGNGQNDDNAGYMAGIRYVVAQNNAEVADGVSNGTSAPVCFDGLPAGEYQVAQILPAALQMTTAGNINISIEPGIPIALEFGSRLKDDTTNSGAVADAGSAAGDDSQALSGDAAAADSDQVAASTDSGLLGNLGIWELAALCIMGVAVLLLGIVALMLLRNQGFGSA
ncbi:MAG: carbohydrate binding domain-containing protein [Ardenticatenaceae bacterium]|nr:carbohydrate binding domain-containing protein [Ardenticatenaceae bacterium]